MVPHVARKTAVITGRQ